MLACWDALAEKPLINSINILLVKYRRNSPLSRQAGFHRLKNRVRFVLPILGNWQILASVYSFVMILGSKYQTG